MRSKLTKNIVFSFIYQFIMMCFPLIITPIISRSLGAEAIGIYTYHYTIAQYFILFVMLGLTNYGNRTIAMCDRNNKESLSFAFWEIYTMQLSCAGFVLILYVAYIVFVSTYKIFDLLFMLLIVSSVFDIVWFYHGIEEIGVILLRNIIVKAITLVFIVFFIHDPKDIILYSAIMVFSTLLSQLSLWVPLRSRVSYVKINVTSALKKHLKPNLILFIPVIAVSIYKYMDKIMLGNMTVSSELGFYESVERMVNIPVSLVSALGTVMLPHISNLNAHGAEKRGISYMRYSLYFTAFLSFGLVFGMLAVIETFVPLFFGNGFDRCITLAFYMIPTVVFLGLSNVFRTQYLIPREKDTVFIGSVILGAIVNLILNYILIPREGAKGAAIGTFFAEMVVFLYQLIKIPRTEKMIQTTVKCLSFLPGSVGMFILIRILPRTSSLFKTLIFDIVVGGSTYLLFSLVTIQFMKKFYADFNIDVLHIITKKEYF